MKKIKVVRVIDRLVGGPTKHVVALTAGMDPDRFDCVLITGSPAAGEVDMTQFARDHGISPVLLPEMTRELGMRDVTVLFRLLREFFQLKPDIVHTHKSKAGALGRVAATIYKWLTPSAMWLRPRRVRIFHTFHGHVFHGYFGRIKSAVFVLIERLLARWCTDLILVICPQQRQEIAVRYRVGQLNQFRIVPLGLDMNLAPSPQACGKLRSEFGIGPEELVIGAVGRICEVKNFGLLIRAFAQCRAQAPATRLVLIGDGQARAPLERLAQELRLGDAVIFTGYRTDTMSLYPDFDVVALCSLNEGTPLALIEGMSCGRPVIATEVGGVAALMGNRRFSGPSFTTWDHGVTSPSGDVDAFSAGLQFLLERPELRRQAGGAARTFVRKQFSQERLIADMEELYCPDAVPCRITPEHRPEILAAS